MIANLETIYNDFHSKLRSFTIRRVSDPDTAEDILQDVYLKIHTHIDDVQQADRLESWIYQITRNAITDYYRHTRPQEQLSEALAAPSEDEPDAVAELAPSVLDMMRCIPRKYREALEMTDLQGLTQAQLAERLNISVSGAKSRVQRAREKLREAFLACCHFELDGHGQVISYHARCAECEGDNSLDFCKEDPDDE